jgi:hypothetical protein
MTRMITTPAHRKTREPSPPDWMMRRVRRIGFLVLALELLAFFAWSTVLYDRFAGSFDFAQFMQSWTLIAHGHLNPYDTVHGFQFWRDHSEFLVWPLALLYWVWPHGVTLLWIQDVCVVGAEAVAFAWLCETAERHRPGRDGACLAAAGLVLLVINPWTWWAVSWDFHTESLAIPFAALLLWDLANGRRRAWVWVAPLLLCGDVAGTYLAGAGISTMIASRGARLRGLIMTVMGVAAVLVITLVHGNIGSGGAGLSRFDYLAGVAPAAGQLTISGLVKGIALHPGGVLSALWRKRLDIWAGLGPSGLLGIGYIWLLPITVVVVLANNLAPGLLFSTPSFQYLPLYVLMPVGTVAVLAWLAGRHRRTAIVLTGLIVAQAIAWSAIWLPRTPGQWLRVSAPAAATLARIQALIPGSSEVVASQGVMGPLSGRTNIDPLFGTGLVPVQGETWFVVAPLQGIETLNTGSAMALIGELAGPLHATLVVHAHGVWAFRWRVPAGVRSISVPHGFPPLLGWTGPGAAGRAIMAGPVKDWHVTSTGGRGYVADELAWQEPAGHYRASVTLSASGPVNVEVWNDTGHILITRRTIPSTNGIESLTMPVAAATPYRGGVFRGWGLFRADFTAPPPGERLEVRVWSPGHETVNVYRATLAKAG